MKKIILILLILLLFLNTISAQEQPQLPTEQILDRINALDEKINSVIKSQLDLGTTMHEEISKTASGEDLNKFRDEIYPKIDRKIETPTLVYALVLNDIFIFAIFFWLKGIGRL